MSHINASGKVKDISELKFGSHVKQEENETNEVKEARIKQLHKEMQEKRDPEYLAKHQEESKNFVKSEIAGNELSDLSIEFLQYVRVMRKCCHIAETRRLNWMKLVVTTYYYTDGQLNYHCPEHKH